MGWLGQLVFCVVSTTRRNRARRCASRAPLVSAALPTVASPVNACSAPPSQTTAGTLAMATNPLLVSQLRGASPAGSTQQSPLASGHAARRQRAVFVATQGLSASSPNSPPAPARAAQAPSTASHVMSSLPTPQPAMVTTSSSHLAGATVQPSVSQGQIVRLRRLLGRDVGDHVSVSQPGAGAPGPANGVASAPNGMGTGGPETGLTGVLGALGVGPSRPGGDAQHAALRRLGVTRNADGALELAEVSMQFQYAFHAVPSCSSIMQFVSSMYPGVQYSGATLAVSLAPVRVVFHSSFLACLLVINHAEGLHGRHCRGASRRPTLYCATRCSSWCTTHCFAWLCFIASQILYLQQPCVWRPSTSLLLAPWQAAKEALVSEVVVEALAQGAKVGDLFLQHPATGTGTAPHCTFEFGPRPSRLSHGRGLVARAHTRRRLSQYTCAHSNSY
jgi:hypothetical protein